jgi:cytochrome c peroxidase
MMEGRGAVILLVATLFAACTAAPRHEPHFLPKIESALPLPPSFPAPLTPPDDRFTVAKAELGRHLFYDVRLSRNETESCASCHQQSYAFSDHRPQAIGSTGQSHFRNSMGLTNVAYRRPLTWADPDVRSLEQQVLVPLTNEHPVELGMAGRYELLLERIGRDPRYSSLFASAFPGEERPLTIANIARALATFERTLISGGSAYDRLVLQGDSTALSPAAWRGMRLFFSPRLRCSSCHGGADLSSPADGQQFQNTGLYDRKSYEKADPGLSAKSRSRRDVGKFRVPSLRNVAVTAPYMHDGSTPTLSQVIDDYAAGGRAARTSGKRPARSVAVRPFSLSASEKQDLIAFLESLTDEGFLIDPRFANPWPASSPSAVEAASK